MDRLPLKRAPKETHLALTPQSNDAFFREVDEELRRDRAEQFLRRHGRQLVVALAVLLVAIGGFLWWQNHRAERAGRDSEALTQALVDVEKVGAAEQAGRKALSGLAGSSRDGYRAAARLALADIAMQKGDLKAAAAAYGAIAADEGLAQPYRDLALVRQTAAEYDTLPTGTVRARLGGLAQPGSPWFGSAGEMVAASWLKDGRTAEAGRLFARLVGDPGVPETIRSRAVQMTGVLGVDAVPATIGGQSTR